MCGGGGGGRSALVWMGKEIIGGVFGGRGGCLVIEIFCFAFSWICFLVM